MIPGQLVGISPQVWLDHARHNLNESVQFKLEAWKYLIEANCE